MGMTDTPINFTGYRIDKLIYSHLEQEDQPNVKFEGGVGISDDSKNGVVHQNVTVVNKEANVSIVIEITGFFVNESSLSKEKFKEYLVRNGSAMLYPYVRSVVSLISSLDSSKNVVLHSLNFVDAYENFSKDN